jgi:hypothetical protein
MKVSGVVDSKDAEERDVTHFINPPAVVAVLCTRHGEADACKIALREQRRAKRAGSKRRFVFWREVVTQIDG